MRNSGVIRLAMRTPGESRFNLGAWQRHREGVVKFGSGVSLALLGTVAGSELAGAASAKRTGVDYTSTEDTLFIVEIASCVRSPNKAPEPTTTAVMPRADDSTIE